MSRGSDYSHVHMAYPHHIVYMQEWTRDVLQHDDVEIHDADLNDPEDGQYNNNGSGLNGGSGAWKAHLPNGQRRREPGWKDLDLKQFLSENHSSNLNNDPMNPENSDNEGESNNRPRSIMGPSSYRFNNGEPVDNSTGGIHVVSHDHTILQTVKRKSLGISTSGIGTSDLMMMRSLSGLRRDFSTSSSANTTGTTTTSLSRNTNRLTMTDKKPNIFKTP